MGVGAVIGLTLGPKSDLLEKDTYLTDDASKVTLLADPGDPESELPVPDGVALEMRAGDVTEEKSGQKPNQQEQGSHNI